MCTHQPLQYNTHQLRQRHRPRRHKSIKISASMLSMQRIFPLIAYLWSTILIYQKCSHDVHKNIMHHPSVSTVVVDAFSINGRRPRGLRMMVALSMLLLTTLATSMDLVR